MPRVSLLPPLHLPTFFLQTCGLPCVEGRHTSACQYFPSTLSPLPSLSHVPNADTALPAPLAAVALTRPQTSPRLQNFLSNMCPHCQVTFSCHCNILEKTQTVKTFRNVSELSAIFITQANMSCKCPQNTGVRAVWLAQSGCATGIPWHFSTHTADLLSASQML